MNEVQVLREEPPTRGHVPAEAVTPWVFEPAATFSPLIVSIPHAGLLWPEEIARPPELDLVRNADDRVDELYLQAPQHGAAILRANFSRLIVDLNRAPNDIAPHLVQDHPCAQPRAVPPKVRALARRLGLDARQRGVIWDLAIGDVKLFERMSYAEFEARLTRYYWPYYEALDQLVARRRAAFGFAIVLDAHSMPSAVPYDMVLGTREGVSAAPHVIELARHALFGDLENINALPYAARSQGRRHDPHDARGLRAAIDDPYEGGHVVERFGRPQDGLHALQLEVNRGVYLARRAPVATARADGGQSGRARLAAEATTLPSDGFQTAFFRTQPLAAMATTPARHLLERRILGLVRALADVAASPQVSGSALRRT